MKVAGITLALATAALAQNSSLPTLQEVLANQSSLSQLANLAAPYLANIASANPGGNITLFAPNNEAVGKLLNSSAAASINDTALISALLSYHIIQGNYTNITNTSFLASELLQGNYAQVTGGQRVEAVVSDGSFSLLSGLLQNSTINGSAIQTQNGVVHIINSFLTLPQNITTSLVELNLTAAVGALEATNLTSTLAGTSDVTYFIPNNAAFQRIGGLLTNLTMSNMTELVDVLKYHVVEGSVLYSTDIMNGSMVSSLEGANLTVRTSGSDVYVNNAKVVIPNVLVANGVVHVIDRVLNPMNTTLTPSSSTVDDFNGATSASNVPFTSGVPTPSSAINTASAATAGSGSSSSSKGGAWQPAVTGALNMGACFGGAAIVYNNL